jgi:hypothetical protein
MCVYNISSECSNSQLIVCVEMQVFKCVVASKRLGDLDYLAQVIKLPNLHIKRCKPLKPLAYVSRDQTTNQKVLCVQQISRSRA